MMLQLDPVLPLDTPRGPGVAFMVIDYGAEHSLIFVTVQDDDGQIWCWPNAKVRGRKNITMGRPQVDNVKPTETGHRPAWPFGKRR